MKNITSRRLALAALGGLLAFATPAFAQSTTEPIDRDNNKSTGPAPAPVVNAEVTAPTTYNPDQPMDRTNKPIPDVNPKVRPVNATPVSNADSRFLKKASVCGETEVALSRQAVSQASNVQVRSFAQTLVTDHERANRELALIVERRGVMVSADDMAAKTVMKFSKKSGHEYDEDFLDEIIDQHEDAIRLYEKASKSKDTDIAAFAVNQLPALRDHLARAQQLDKAID